VDVVVVGAGLGGLALVRDLAARGVDVLALEASERPGGVAWTEAREGRLLETGPQRIRPSGAVRRLVSELGLEDRLLVSPGELPLYVYRDGRLGLVPLSAGELLRTDLLSAAGKLRLLAEPLTGGVRPGETVERYLERKLGREAYLHLVGPLYGGLYGSDPSRMLVEESLGHILRRFGVGRSLGMAVLRMLGRRGQATPPATFFGGMAELPRAMADAHRDRIRFGMRVTDLRREGGRWRVSAVRSDRDAAAAAGDGDRGSGGGASGTGEGAASAAEIEAGSVVVTVPAPEAAPLLRREAPAAAGGVGRLTYNRLVVVHLLAEGELEGLGCQVSLAERGMATRGLTWNAAAFGPHPDAPPAEREAREARAGVHTSFLGGAGREDVAAMGDAEVARLAAAEFRRITGVPARPIMAGRVWMPAWDRSWVGIGGLELPAGLDVCAAWSERPGIPGRLDQAARTAASIAGGGQRPAR